MTGHNEHVQWIRSTKSRWKKDLCCSDFRPGQLWAGDNTTRQIIDVRAKCQKISTVTRYQVAGNQFDCDLLKLTFDASIPLGANNKLTHVRILYCIDEAWARRNMLLRSGFYSIHSIRWKNPFKSNWNSENVVLNFSLSQSSHRRRWKTTANIFDLN